jgi:glutamyl-tRNA reductase
MQMRQLVCLGVSHHTATVALREYLGRTEVANARPAAIRELVMMATCNRAEIYAYMAADVADPELLLIEFLAHTHSMDPARFAEHTYFFSGQAVVEHLCRVAAGLDSLVLGEPQILGQVIDAYQAAQGAHTCGPALSLLFRTAIQAGKRARSETAISTNAASISSVAVTLAQRVTGDLQGRRMLVIGLGDMGRLTIKALRARGVTAIDLVNRTHAKAAEAVKAWDGWAYPLAELRQALAAADVVFTATSAPGQLLTRELVQEIMAGRPERPLVLIDLAVPRDVESTVALLPGVQLYDVDALQANLDEALSVRQREVPRVEAIVAAEVTTWTQKFQELQVEPVIADLRLKAEAIRQHELERTLRFLGEVDAETWQHVQHLTRALVNKLLHEPTVRLKQKAGSAEAVDYADTLRDLFGLATEAEQQAS